MRAKSLALFIAAGFCALVFCGSAHADAVVGKPAPAFVASTLDGKTFDLSTLKGKVVVLHFWATWCAPCREEMPALEAVWRQDHGKGLEVLAISVDRPRARGDVDQVMKYFSFPAALLSAVSKNDFGTLGGIPVTYVIDKEGNLSAVLTPDTQPLTAAGLADQVKNLLEAKAESKPETKTETKTDAPPDAKP
ncbi:MAG: TlpA disulfide reductase family protein [Alphaproteobacteria bacterium]